MNADPASIGTMTIAQPRFMRTVWLLGVSALLLATSAPIIQYHVRVLREAQEALPLLVQIPQRERRMKLLEEQVEVSEVHAATRIGSAEERLHVYVLPEGGNLDRLLAFLELFGRTFERAGILRDFSAVELGTRRRENAEAHGPLEVQPLSLRVTVQEEGARVLDALVSLAGTLTLADALRPEELALLFQRTEAENPAGIVALEPFLSTDLLAYVGESKSHEDRILKSFPSEESLAMFKSILQSALIQNARRLFGGELGAAVLRENLWPLQFLAVEEVELSELPGGWHRLTLHLLAYGRPKEA